MKKRIIATLVCLCMLVGMLPVTALAEGTAPQTLYVGSTTITAGYWTSSDDGTNWTSPQEEPTGDSYIYYDGQGTLKLHNATIQGGSTTESAPFGSGIYALSSSNQPVALTIKLIGENTITGDMGIYVAAEASATSYGTDASLTITSENNGSLQVSGLNYGIYVKSGTGNASLTINDASVVAKTTQTYSSFAGVYVQSSAHATSSPQLSLAVNGGSLTTSASKGNDGIQFYVGSSQASKATTSLTVSDNAIVDAKNGGISAKQISNPINTDISATGSNGGIVFDGTEGTVYGDVELQDDFEITSGETLKIPDGSSLNCNDKLTNNGTINVESGGKLEGTTTGQGTLKIAPTITTQPQDVEVIENETAIFTVEATGSDLSYQWQQSTDNGNSWTNIASATSDTYTTGKTTMDMNGYQYRCVVKNSIDEVTSNTATLTVNASQVVPPEPPIGYPITVTPTQNGKVEVPTSIASEESLVTITVTPDTGYELSSLTVTDKEGKEVKVTPKGDSKYTFHMPKGGVTITGKFQKIKLPFTDVSQEHWFYDAVCYVYQHGIMEGISDTTFAPFSSLSRGMMVQIFYNLEGQPAVVGKNEFNDVSKNQWFYDAITWASQNDVVNGYDNNIFLADQNITREELAQMLYNYAKYKGYDVSASANLSQYPDGAKVSDWAKTALSWANGNGLITGHENNTIDPNGTANRAQTATILMRFHQTFLSK